MPGSPSPSLREAAKPCAWLATKQSPNDKKVSLPVIARSRKAMCTAGDEAISKRQKGLPPRHCEKPQSRARGWRRSNLQTTKRSPSPSLREAAKPCARLATKQSPNDKKVSLPVIARSRKAVRVAGDEAIS